MQLLTLILQTTTVADTVAKTASNLPGKAPEEFSSPPILELLAKGGSIMIVLLALLVLAIFFIIERFLYINGRSKMDHNLMNVVRDNMSQNRQDAALAYCERTPTAQSQVVATGLRFLGSNMREIESAMETRANVELSAMESNLNYLSLVSRIAPMLGFVGTLWGVITIFYDVAQHGELELGGISKGLYIKMITSLSGLSVGIIAFVFYQLLLRRIDRFAERLQEQSLGFLEIINKSHL